MRIRRRIRNLRNFIQRVRDTFWFMRKLGYPLGLAWQRAGWWQ